MTKDYTFICCKDYIKGNHSILLYVPETSLRTSLEVREVSAAQVKCPVLLPTYPGPQRVPLSEERKAPLQEGGRRIHALGIVAPISSSGRRPVSAAKKRMGLWKSPSNSKPGRKKPRTHFTQSNLLCVDTTSRALAHLHGPENLQCRCWGVCLMCRQAAPSFLAPPQNLGPTTPCTSEGERVLSATYPPEHPMARQCPQHRRASISAPPLNLGSFSLEVPVPASGCKGAVCRGSPLKGGLRSPHPERKSLGSTVI